MNSILAVSELQGPVRRKETFKAAIRQQLNHEQSKERPLLILEGDDDILFYSKCLGPEYWRFACAGGCESVIDFLNEFVPRYGNILCGVIDSDFRRINNDIEPFDPTQLARNLFVTDLHDWENWMVSDMEIERYWNSNMQPANYDKLHEILPTAKRGIKYLSYVKWYHSRRKIEVKRDGSERKGGYNFAHCKMENCFNKDVKDCISILLSTQKTLDDKFDISIEDLENFVTSFNCPDEKQLFVGHDLCDSVVFYMKQIGRPIRQIKKREFSNFLIDYGSKDIFLHSRLNSDLSGFLDAFHGMV